MDFSKRMTMREAGAYLGRSKCWVQRNRLKLGIPHYQIGGQCFFIKEELDQWISSKRLEMGSTGRKRARELVEVTL
jgi:hypothetical protein